MFVGSPLCAFVLRPKFPPIRKNPLSSFFPTHTVHFSITTFRVNTYAKDRGYPLIHAVHSGRTLQYFPYNIPVPSRCFLPPTRSVPKNTPGGGVPYISIRNGPPKSAWTPAWQDRTCGHGAQRCCAATRADSLRRPSLQKRGIRGRRGWADQMRILGGAGRARHHPPRGARAARGSARAWIAVRQ